RGEVRAGKVVLAAGIGNARLGPMVGLDVPVRPQRGQLIVTEKTAPFLDYPVSTVRQTDEGGVMIGDSQEEAGLDASVGQAVIAVLADRAQRMFPKLGALNVVRTWAALRVMTRDGFPIYDQSTECPGAFVATCRTTLGSGAPRGPYCMMGVCLDCLVTIDGVGNRQACLVRVTDGMAIAMQRGKRELAP